MSHRTLTVRSLYALASAWEREGRNAEAFELRCETADEIGRTLGNVANNLCGSFPTIRSVGVVKAHATRRAAKE